MVMPYYKNICFPCEIAARCAVLFDQMGEPWELIEKYKCMKLPRIECQLVFLPDKPDYFTKKRYSELSIRLRTSIALVWELPKIHNRAWNKDDSSTWIDYGSVIVFCGTERDGVGYHNDEFESSWGIDAEGKLCINSCDDWTERSFGAPSPEWYAFNSFLGMKTLSEVAGSVPSEVIAKARDFDFEFYDDIHSLQSF